ncbi:MAG: 30S ribosomal protein S6 [Bacteroidales bacterium]|nr:30S ribosomal protein S6 [Bacteroidales bacterium]
MAKLTGSYEAMVIFSTKDGEEAAKALVSKFNEMIESNGSEITLNEWGKRKLAYEINYATEGYYALWDFTSKPDFPAEFERVLNITEGVVRYLVTNK